MLQEACEILRRTLRFLYYARRLKEQLRGGTREIPKVNRLSSEWSHKRACQAAHTLSEIHGLTEDVDLTGVDVVDAEMGWIFTAKGNIQRQARVMLAHGMESHNQVQQLSRERLTDCMQAQVATALQVFRNLHMLPEEIDNIVTDRLDVLFKAFPQALDLVEIATETETAGQGLCMHACSPQVHLTRSEQHITYLTPGNPPRLVRANPLQLSVPACGHVLIS